MSIQYEHRVKSLELELVELKKELQQLKTCIASLDPKAGTLHLPKKQQEQKYDGRRA